MSLSVAAATCRNRLAHLIATGGGSSCRRTKFATILKDTRKRWVFVLVWIIKCVGVTVERERLARHRRHRVDAHESTKNGVIVPRLHVEQRGLRILNVRRVPADVRDSRQLP